jgi:hypothetical protein
LTCREEALAVREEKAKISEKALVKVSVDLDTKWAKAEATRKEYLNKMEAHTTHAKHRPHQALPQPWQYARVKKVELKGRERDLDLCRAVLVKAQSWWLEPRDNSGELMEVIEL